MEDEGGQREKTAANGVEIGSELGLTPNQWGPEVQLSFPRRRVCHSGVIAMVRRGLAKA